ncbi:MAG: helix-turn-helix transcriptional regulator [Kurthia sp.]
MQWHLMRLRKERKLSQVKMAEFLKVDVTTYHNKETSKTKFNLDEMFLLSNYFGLPIEDIFLPTNSNEVVINDQQV